MRLLAPFFSWFRRLILTCKFFLLMYQNKQSLFFSSCQRHGKSQQEHSNVGSWWVTIQSATHDMPSPCSPVTMAWALDALNMLYVLFWPDSLGMLHMDGNREGTIGTSMFVLVISSWFRLAKLSATCLIKFLNALTRNCMVNKFARSHLSNIFRPTYSYLQHLQYIWQMVPGAVAHFLWNNY